MISHNSFTKELLSIYIDTIASFQFISDLSADKIIESLYNFTTNESQNKKEKENKFTVQYET